MFAPPALKKIERSSLGLTRRINILADKALLAAFSSGSHQVGAKEIEAAIRDCEFSGATHGGKRSRNAQVFWISAAFVICALAGLVWLTVSQTDTSGPAIPAGAPATTAAAIGAGPAAPPPTTGAQASTPQPPDTPSAAADVPPPAIPPATSPAPDCRHSIPRSSHAFRGTCRSQFCLPDAIRRPCNVAANTSCKDRRRRSRSTAKTSQSKSRAANPRTTRSRTGMAGTIAG